ncbi:hypothetical protein DL764_004901 [Monosporascus ibericus]|uniref:F-box domain-containing protein n=1 Tax=Monosporascus ibericus TaxID=155417 RepID=A0A4V1XAS7_9PEZI|nr:hypothetical protein DL764_004901 [Monosporascus ibericus]
MGSVMGPGPAPRVHNGFPPETFAARDRPNRDTDMRTNRSTAAATGPTYAQGQRPDRMPQGPNPMPRGPNRISQGPNPTLQGVPAGYRNQMQRPSMYDRPRPSSSSSSSASTVLSGDGFEVTIASPSSSRSSFTSFDSLEMSPRRPEHGFQRPAPIKQNRQRRAPGELFAALPDEVLELTLSSLREKHLRPGSDSCATCMMRDLCSVAVAARRFLRPARAALYEDVRLVGADSQVQKKRYRLGCGTRLVLLRRTLRSNPHIAALVRSLKAPAVPADTPLDKYQNLVASVIMACPNFERLVGFHQNYDHSFNRLFYALSTREHLKEMTWVVEASSPQGQPRAKPDPGASPGDLRPDQGARFVELHVNWSRLTTLAIHCLPGATITPVSLLGNTMAHLPALEHLYLSCFPPTAFNDSNLLSLPPLRTLSLSHMRGVTSAGLAAFTRRPSSQSIKGLTLRHTNLDSLPVLGRIFFHLTSLETFSLVQEKTLLLPEDEVIWLFPYLASRTLRKLHWDVTSHPTCANVADSILARSIEANGFPSLRVLRAPNDPEGLFQALCKPEARIERAGDRYRGLIVRAANSKPDPAAATTPTTPKTPTRSPLSFMFPDTYGAAASSPSQRETAAALAPPAPRCSNLVQSRIAAQGRLEAAWARPRFVVNVVDEGGAVVKKFELGGFLGDTASRIRYRLTPDEGATDEGGGLVGFADLLGDRGEDLRDGEGAAGGCEGRWNARDIGDKRDRERWWHVERGFWRDVRLS